MKRTSNLIRNVTDADIWVMDKKTEYIDEVKTLTDNNLYRVRRVPGVQWVVRLFKGQPRAKAPDGGFRIVIMMGLADSSLVGAPSRDKMIPGSVEDLRQPESAIIDRAGYYFLFPVYLRDLADFLTVLDNERSVYAAEDHRVQSERTLVVSLIALYKALGGGWEPAQALP